MLKWIHLRHIDQKKLTTTFIGIIVRKEINSWIIAFFFMRYVRCGLFLQIQRFFLIRWEPMGKKIREKGLMTYLIGIIFLDGIDKFEMFFVLF